MTRTFVLALVVAGGLLACAQPAGAAVASSFSLSGSTNVSAACPVNLNFSGAITGPAGTAVTYLFQRFVGGPINSAPVNATIPPSGTLAVTETLAIDKTHSGFQSNALLITSPSNADNSNGKVFFTVNCTIAGTTLGPGMQPLVRPVVTLHSLEWTWRRYTYEYVGPVSTYVPEFGTGPCTDLCVGWLHVKQGDSGWLYHHNDFLRGWLAFANTVKTLKATKATLTLSVAGGDPGCLGGVGMAKGPWAGVSTHDFKTGVPTDGDFSWPTTFSVNGSSVTFDVTSIVQAWESGHSNDGFVIRGKTEDNGSDGNDSCSVDFGTDGVLTIQQ